MNNEHSFVSRFFQSPKLRAAVLLLVALAWSNLSFGGEIHDAATKGDLNKVKSLLKAKPALVSSKDEKTGRTPLHFAVYYNRKNVVEFLLASHANVNAKANDGRTPLHDAAFSANKSVVELLLASKADVNAVANDKGTPLYYATKLHRNDVAELLRQRGGRE